MSTPDPLQKLPAAEWVKLTGPEIMDPDGWRGALALDWDTPIDYEDFQRRAMESTVRLSRPAGGLDTRTKIG